VLCLKTFAPCLQAKLLCLQALVQCLQIFRKILQKKLKYFEVFKVDLKELQQILQTKR